MNAKIDSAELRAAARYLEDVALSALASYSAIPVAVYSGSVEQFPRASQADEAAQEGFIALRESVQRVVSSMYAIAFAADNGLQLPDVLLTPLRPYIDAFRAQPAGGPKKK